MFSAKDRRIVSQKSVERETGKVDDPWCLTCGANLALEGRTYTIVHRHSNGELCSIFSRVLGAEFSPDYASINVCNRCERHLRRLGRYNSIVLARREGEKLREQLEKNLAKYGQKLIESGGNQELPSPSSDNPSAKSVTGEVVNSSTGQGQPSIRKEGKYTTRSVGSVHFEDEGEEGRREASVRKFSAPVGGLKRRESLSPFSDVERRREARQRKWSVASTTSEDIQRFSPQSPSAIPRRLSLTGRSVALNSYLHRDANRFQRKSISIDQNINSKEQNTDNDERLSQEQLDSPEEHYLQELPTPEEEMESSDKDDHQDNDVPVETSESLRKPSTGDEVKTRKPFLSRFMSRKSSDSQSSTDEANKVDKENSSANKSLDEKANLELDEKVHVAGISEHEEKVGAIDNSEHEEKVGAIENLEPEETFSTKENSLHSDIAGIKETSDEQEVNFLAKENSEQGDIITASSNSHQQLNFGTQEESEHGAIRSAKEASVHEEYVGANGNPESGENVSTIHTDAAQEKTSVTEDSKTDGNLDIKENAELDKNVHPEGERIDNYDKGDNPPTVFSGRVNPFNRDKQSTGVDENSFRNESIDDDVFVSGTNEVKSLPRMDTLPPEDELFPKSDTDPFKEESADESDTPNDAELDSNDFNADTHSVMSEVEERITTKTQFKGAYYNIGSTEDLLQEFANEQDRDRAAWSKLKYTESIDAGDCGVDPPLRPPRKPKSGRSAHKKTGGKNQEDTQTEQGDQENDEGSDSVIAEEENNVDDDGVVEQLRHRAVHDVKANGVEPTVSLNDDGRSPKKYSSRIGKWTIVVIAQGGTNSQVKSEKSPLIGKDGSSSTMTISSGGESRVKDQMPGFLCCTIL